MKRMYEAVIEEIEENPEMELTESEKKELEIIGEQKAKFHTVTPNPKNASNKFLGVCSKHSLDTNKIQKALSEIYGF